MSLKHTKAMFRKYTTFFLPERIPKIQTRILKMEQKNDLIIFLSRKIVIIHKYKNKRVINNLFHVYAIVIIITRVPIL